MATARTPPRAPTGARADSRPGLTVHVAVSGPDADLVADALWQAGAAAIEERPGRLIAAAPAAGAASGTAGGTAGDPAPLLAAVAGRWPAEVVPVEVGAALDAWREHARAVVVGERLVVRPPWVGPPSEAGPGGAGWTGGAADGAAAGHTSPRGSPTRWRAAATLAGRAPIDVVIDPWRAFGHGGHPSTRLVLAAVGKLVIGGERVLDVGCGSGVLAIAAVALGAGRAVAVDIDPAAVAATRDNAARNGVADRVRVLGPAGGLARVTGRFDLVLANMLLPDLVAVAPDVAGRLAPGGAVAVSGVLDRQRRDLVAAYRSVGLAPVPGGDRVEDGWLGITLGAG